MSIGHQMTTGMIPIQKDVSKLLVLTFWIHDFNAKYAQCRWIYRVFTHNIGSRMIGGCERNKIKDQDLTTWGLDTYINRIEQDVEQHNVPLELIFSML